MFCFFSSFFAQEIKFVNPYGKPVEKNKVIVYGKNQDTLITNKNGIINLKRRLLFDSITLFENNKAVITKLRSDIENKINEFSIEKNNPNSLPVFEANTKKHSQLIDALKEINHESITIEEIYNSNASSGAELLLLTDGVTIQKSQGGGGSPIIRGFEANRVLLMIDGVRMNNAIYRSGHLQNSLTIDPFITENCDVIYGPSAVSYGSDAIGGVIHYKTIDPKLSLKKDSNIISTTYLNRFNSAIEENTHHIDLNIGGHKVASFSSFTYKQFGNIKMGEKRTHGYNNWGGDYFSVINHNGVDSMILNENENIQKGVGYEQIDLSQKILYQPNKSFSLLFNSQLSLSSDINRLDQLNNITSSDSNSLETPQFSEWRYGPQKRLMNSLTMNFTNSCKLFDEFSSIFSHQDIEESRITRKFRDSLQNNNIEKVAVLGLHVKAIKEIGQFSNLTYGAEIYNNYVKSNGYSVDIVNRDKNVINSRYPNGGSNLQMSGVYAIYNLQKDHISILTGLRYSINNINSSFLDSTINVLFPEFKLNNQALNGTFNFSYYPHQKTKIHIDISTGFRSPNIDDVGKIFTKDQTITIPNLNLSPEYAYNASLGWNQKFYFINSNVKLNLYNSFYVTLLDNVIIKNGFNFNGSSYININDNNYEIIANQNQNSALVYGYSSCINLSVYKKLILHGSTTLTKGYIKSTQTPFGHIPPLIGNLRLKYVYNNNCSISIFSLFNGYKNLLDFGPGNVDNPLEATIDGYPSWQTINTNLIYNFSKNVSANFGCYNIFDIHYKTFASGISSPGRSFLVSFKLTY